MCCWKVSPCSEVRTWILCRCWFVCVSMCCGSTELHVILLVWMAWWDLQRDLGLLACHHSPTLTSSQTPRSYNSTVTSKASVTFLLQSHLSIIAAARNHGDSWFGVNWTLRVDTGINQYPLSVIPGVSHPGAIINHSTKPGERLTARETLKKRRWPQLFLEMRWLQCSWIYKAKSAKNINTEVFFLCFLTT